MVVEVFLGAFVQLLLERLTPHNLLQFGQFSGTKKKLQKWSATLSAIAAVLQDAEQKQLTSEAVKLWLDDLKHLAFDMDDILDTFSTRLLMISHENGAHASKVRHLFSGLKFNFHMNLEIQGIDDRLQMIYERKDKLGLVYSDYVCYPKGSQRLLSSYVLDGPVVGREHDKKKIVNLLLRDHEPCCAGTNFQVLAIVGMPGLGKTTLAGHVFNDKEMGQFKPKVWVSVSDGFSLERVTKTIFKLVTSRDSDDLDEFSKVQDLLSEALAGKKFLIVLDDVWSTCDYDSWTKLQAPLRVGAPGSRILVTTREEQVAKSIGAAHVYDLKTLSDEDCFEVFQQHINSYRPPNFNLLRTKIVEKCSGLPLAAKTLGGILRCKEAGNWEEVLDDKLWSMSNSESNLLTVLKLSYHYLPSNLKRCFAYCAILPKQYEFRKKQLILLWMAEGFLHQSGSKDMEDIGADHFGELLSRSLFQKSNKNDSRYEMHDLVGDLARWAAGDICFRLEDKVDGTCSPKTRHATYIPGKFDGVKKFQAFSKAKRLRTFLPVSVSYGHENHQTRKVASDLVPNMKYLRVLSFNGYQMTEVPDSIGRLKHLRYLDLSYTLILCLPDSICSLYNLQTLILENCSHLKALPSNFCNLRNLRHLINSGMLSLEGMPPQIGHLTTLQTLSCFVVGEARVSGVKEIGPLNFLRGTLCLSKLENVSVVEDARRADLIRKEGLDALQLEWSGRGEKESDVLDMLKPHDNLKELTIKGYGGLEFSSWICNPLFSLLGLLRLENCTNCRFLPQLGQLPCLKVLFVREMPQIESVGVEFYGEGATSFPALENLVFEDMQQWMGWFPCEGDQTGFFPSLKMLSVIRCPQLVVSVSNYPQLCALQVHDCYGVEFKGFVNFELLEHIYLSNLSVLGLENDESEECMKGLRNVRGLGITNSEELSESWWNEDIILQHVSSLRSLFIERNSRFLQLHHLTSLQALRLYRCEKLVSIPEACLPPSLKDLWIEKCDYLACFASYQIPSSLRKVGIRDCRWLELLVGEDVEDSSSSSSCLEYLEVWECPSLTSLSPRGQLPTTLKHLHIRDCERLESITDRFLGETCVEHIVIQSCANLKSLPDGLCDLAHLQQLIIMDCGSLISFPSGGFPTTASLTTIFVYNCDNLEAFPGGMAKHIHVQTLWIGYCEGLTSVVEEGFSPNLVELYIVNPLRCKPFSQWGLQLQRLNFLKDLWIQGVDTELVSFPPEEMETLLPKSLTKIRMGDFPKLQRLSSKAFQSLTSLESLRIEDCPKLASIPEKHLPVSLTQLHISNCHLLKKRYRPGKQQAHWSKICHIPYIQIV